MHRRRLKPIVFVKLPGPLVKRMHEYGSYPRVARHGYRAIDSIL